LQFSNAALYAGALLYTMVYLLVVSLTKVYAQTSSPYRHFLQTKKKTRNSCRLSASLFRHIVVHANCGPMHLIIVAYFMLNVRFYCSLNARAQWVREDREEQETLASDEHTGVYAYHIFREI
jgi:hypothetical protein